MNIPIAAIAIIFVIFSLFMLSYAPNFNGFGIDMTIASASDVTNFQLIWITGIVAGIAVLFASLMGDVD